MGTMEQALLINLVIFVLSFLSGMLGPGVAFVAIPALGLFGFELKHVIMPWARLLNGLTAISAAVAYLRNRMVDLRTGVPLMILTTLAAPVGVYLLRFVETATVWWVFVGVLIFLAIRMATKKAEGPELAEMPQGKRDRRVRGFLGVGPGFLLMPTLVLVGYTARIAAATNSLAVTLPAARRTLAVGVVSDLIRGDVFYWGSLMAGAVLASLPIVIIYVLLFDYYVTGLTAGSVKG